MPRGDGGQCASGDRVVGRMAQGRVRQIPQSACGTVYAEAGGPAWTLLDEQWGDQRMTSLRYASFVAVMAATLSTTTLVLDTPAEARRSRERATLAPTGAAPDASGLARFVLRSRRGTVAGKLDVRVRKLAPGQRFEVTLDGVRLGSLQTNRRGRGVLRLRTRPRGDAVLLGVDPRGRTLSVVGAGGVVLGAPMPASSLDPGDVRCCLPDDSGSECEDRTPAECAAEGGVDMGAGSCLPNPCAGSTPPPVGDVVCCMPDDSGPECEDRTVAECGAQGGVVVGGVSCLPNPCAATTPTTVPGGGTTTTTMPGGGGRVRVRCERRTNRSRASVDGSNLRPGSYGARLTSGPNVATAPPRPSVGDEVEHDFDSAPDDVAAGAIAIGADFIVGSPPAVTGALLDANGNVVAQATVTCAFD